MCSAVPVPGDTAQYEPFANLDHDGRDMVLRALEERTLGRGLVVVHHGDEDLDGRFDRVVNLAAANVNS